jgi:5-methylcytosine-specific restriction protein B
MQEMRFIAMDQWRVLNEELFRNYIICFGDLQDGVYADPGQSMMNALEKCGILGKVQPDDYGSYYTIARELGIYYEDSAGYHLGDLAREYRAGRLSYADYLRHYALNVEFVIRGKLIHPFGQIIEILGKGAFSADEILRRIPSFDPGQANSRIALKYLKLFLNRVVKSGLLKETKGQYSLSMDYTVLKAAVNKSGLDTSSFSRRYIGSSNEAQENFVKEIINRPIDRDLMIEPLERREELFNAMEEKREPLNVILYGPPGTGKTYSTVLKAMKILGIPYTDYEDAFEKFRNELGNRVEFVTLHQSFSYEDFVQGLRPGSGAGSIRFDYVDGVFRKICHRANEAQTGDKSEISDNPVRNREIAEIAFFLSKFNGKKANQKQGVEMLGYSSDAEAFHRIGEKLGIKPNTLKNHRDKFDYAFRDRENYTARKGWVPRNGTGQLDNTELWPYRDVYEELNQMGIEDVGDRIKQIIANGSQRAAVNPEGGNFVIILDEINRANVSKVFGELITLIEDDKRDRYTVRLPSGDLFSVPSNLYIIGTMNTADKSLSMVDLALRRRFEFEAMYPEPELIEDGKKRDFMKRLNSEIISRKGIDFQVGHSEFMKDTDLISIINRKIVPLLMEYFRSRHQEVADILRRSLPAGMAVNEEKLQSGYVSVDQ